MTSKNDKDKQPQYWEHGHLSFSGGGFIGIYHVGVVLAFKEFAPHIASRKALGTSSGALASTCLAAGYPVYQAISGINQMAVHCRSLSFGPLNPRFNMAEIIRTYLQEHLPKDAHKRCSGKLFISTTRVITLTNKVFTEFESRDELIEVLLASCFIPYFLGLVPPKVRGVSYIDGGITDNLQIHDENTITVSPFAGIAIIRPQSSNPFLSDIVYTPENAIRIPRTIFAPPPKVLEDICQQGYADALRFIREHDLFACDDCAQLASRPVRGDCSKCQAFIENSLKARVQPYYVQTLRDAQAAEDAADAANPYQYKPLMRIMNFLRAIAYLPADAAIVATVKASHWWSEIVDMIKRSLENGFVGMCNYARKFLRAQQTSDMCGGPTTAFEGESSR
ncbi:patatin phospholipase domain-containing protein 2-like [Tropilaelaps mercedesae]|uniref:Patatin phospholipase domain-containing protein 2-like n=1 Tax=Tropilaelaps mercedesae TaxID=418985 RepID=A0A1V9X709_9ACAR|nr:patatin phospholipase domain-containing protein 2-like [Tropilaelaps mercedesae]